MLNVYIVMTDPKGVFAFQPATRERWERALSIAALHTNKEAFRMVFSDTEEQFVKAMINQKKYMACAYYITKLRLFRGDYRE